ncbi:MAG: hypothetical protein AB1601_04440 [Planctomycetota bacterium]
MTRKMIMGLWMSLSFTTPALGSNWIEEWGGAPNIQYTIYQEEHMIVLESAGTFKFWAYDPEDPNRPPGHIESITVAPGVTGVINLYIAHPDGPEFWGAQDVDLVDYPVPPRPTSASCGLTATWPPTATCGPRASPAPATSAATFCTTSTSSRSSASCGVARCRT